MSDVALMDAPVEAAEDYRSMTLLNEMGDVEVTWDSKNDDAMREVIDKKMKEGILSIGNAANCSETAYTLEWLVPHLPSRGTRAIDLDNIAVSQPRWAVPGVTDKKRKTERILRELRRYAYEEVLQEHQPLLSNMRAVTQGSFYLADYSVADHGDAVPLRAPTADIQGDAALVVQEGLDALDEILNQMPQPRDMDHARLIEQALEQVLEADTEWVDPIGY